MRKQHICMSNQQTAQKMGQSMVGCIRQPAILQLRLTGCEKIYTAMQCNARWWAVSWLRTQCKDFISCHHNAAQRDPQCISMQSTICLNVIHNVFQYNLQCISMQSTIYLLCFAFGHFDLSSSENACVKQTDAMRCDTALEQQCLLKSWYVYRKSL